MRQIIMDFVVHQTMSSTMHVLLVQEDWQIGRVTSKYQIAKQDAQMMHFVKGTLSKL